MVWVMVILGDQVDWAKDCFFADKAGVFNDEKRQR